MHNMMPRLKDCLTPTSLYMIQRSKAFLHGKLACRWRKGFMTAPRYEQVVGQGQIVGDYASGIRQFHFRELTD